MAEPSIFDCAELSPTNEPTRKLVSYDDDDLFTFGSVSPFDKIDNASQNVSIRVTVNNGNGKRNIKRKTDGTLAGSNGFSKKQKLNAPNDKVTKTNGTVQRSVEKHSNSSEYDFLEMIGNGTYGRVYRARLNATNEVIAVKRLECKLNTAHTSTSLAFIKREYDHLSELQDCINVVQLLKGRDRNVTPNDLAVDLLFEYCPHDLRKIISNKNVQFQLAEIKSFMRQMLIGLDHMHSKSIMHRDFKTENILLTTDGVVKIADFGLSRRISDPLATLQKEIYTPNVVTQWYRAPEILLGDSQYNEQVDMWSMGCVMGEFWNRSAILPGGNEIGQIKLISKLCGSIKPENWPNVVNMRGFQQIKLMPTDSRKTRFYLKGKTPKVPDDQANDFFDRLLECNPEKRFNAARALNDNFFYISPLPTKCLKNFMNRILPILRSPTSIALN